MNFSAVACLARGGVDDDFGDTAAEIVGNASPSTLLDNTSGRAAKGAREAAASVVAHVRRLVDGHNHARQQPELSDVDAVSTTRDGAAQRWRSFNAGLEEVQAKLANDTVAIPSQVFQAQLLLALRHQASLKLKDRGGLPVEACVSAGPGLVNLANCSEERSCQWCPRPLAILWRLHESGLLPLKRLLEMNEAFPSPFVHHNLRTGEGRRGLFEEPSEDVTDLIVRDMTALVTRSASEAGDLDHQQGDAGSLLSDVARHLFDIGYRKPSSGLEGLAAGGDTNGASSVGRGQLNETLATRAARGVLDRLCSGPEMFREGGVAARLRACQAVLAAIDPLPAPGAPFELDLTATDSAVRPGLLKVVPAGSSANGEGVPCSAKDAVCKDETTLVFVARQLRHLMDHASGQSERTQGEDTSAFKVETAANEGGVAGILVDIMRHFSSAHFVEVLHSICRRTIASAADAVGLHLHKPLLQWETLGPIVCAAATAHSRVIPPAVALIGTELAAAAVNLVPSGDADVPGMTDYSQEQGVLVLSVALRLVAQADVSSQGADSTPYSRGGLYARWVRGCFGVVSRTEDAGLENGSNQVRSKPDPSECARETGVSDRSADTHVIGSKAVRDAMEKQRATEVLMKALCLSVPSDPAFVLEVHKDVLKTRLRAKFSIQVRDLMDLVVTRLSDLKRQEERGRRMTGSGCGFPRGAGLAGSTSHPGGDGGDPTSREVGFFLRQFKQTGEVPPALKTAILWHPMSWANFRKVLLAPPAERIAMPDDSGNVLPVGEDKVTEAIGQGDNGLRVEVSLKYRRLLVQQLAKDRLLSKKDHEAFRQSYVEYLQGQRQRDATLRNGHTDQPEAASAVVRQLLQLESKLAGRKRGGSRHGDDESGRIEEKNRHAESVLERLALLLQEYLPRALVVELCIEDEERPISPTTADARDRACRSPTGRSWFERAAHSLSQILEEWKLRLRWSGTSSGEPVSPVSGYPLPRAQKEQWAHPDALPKDVAEAILNSTHCCVAAVSVSLGQDLRVPLFPLPPPHPSVSDTTRMQQSTEPDQGGPEDIRLDGSRHEEHSSGDPATAFLGPLAAQAFQRLGEVVSVAAEVEALGEAICQRCFSLLANPTMLDTKQVLTLSHVVAGLPPAFHPKVEGFLADLVANTVGPTSAGCIGGGLSRSHAVRRTRSWCKKEVGLVAIAQVGAFYLQSTLLLHGEIRTCASGMVDSGSPGRSLGQDSAGRESHASRKRQRSAQQSVGPMRDDGGGSSEHLPDKESVGLAPVVLLDFLWWMERRLAIAGSTSEGRTSRVLPMPELVGLLKLLRSVLNHSLVHRVFRRTFSSPLASMPPLERLIALEMAVASKDDFFVASGEVAFLESATLGRLVGSSSYPPARGVPWGSIDGCDEDGERSRLVSARRDGENKGVEDIKGVWRECAGCLFANSSLLNSARKRVRRDVMPYLSREGSAVRNKKGVLGWELFANPSCAEREIPDEHLSDLVVAEGVTKLLDSLLRVMGKLINFEATAGSICHGLGPSARLDETCAARKAGKGGGRGASTLLSETLGMLTGMNATEERAVSPAIVLVIELAIPAIGATEGRAKAIDSLRLVWEEWFRKVLPLEYGMIASLAQTSLMWYAGQGGECNGCPVVQMIEDFPVLAVEIVRVWPRLASTLLSAIGAPGEAAGEAAGPYARGGWASHLSTLHRFGGQLVRDLAGGTLGVPEPAEPFWSREAAIPLTAQSTTPETYREEGGGSRREDGRVPLGPVNECTRMQKGKQEWNPPHEAQLGDRQAPQHGLKVRSAGHRTCAPGGRLGVGHEDAATVTRTQPAPPVDPPKRGQDRSRDVTEALPRTCAELIVRATCSVAATVSVKTPNRARQTQDTLASAKRAKTGVDASVRGMSKDFERPDVPDAGYDACRPIRFKIPKPRDWVARVLEPLYGPGSKESAVSILLALLESAVEALGNTTRGEEEDGDAYSLALSLVVAVLGHTHPIVLTRLAEPPFLAPSAASTGPSERLGRSLGVLACLKRLSEEKPRWHTAARATWLTVILSHYAEAISSIACMREDSGDGAGVIPGRAWAVMVAFVHARLRQVSPQELRLVPVAVALQELDPLLMQYF